MRYILKKLSEINKENIILKKIITILVFLFTIQVSNSQTTLSIRLDNETGQDAYIATNYQNINWGFHRDIVSISWTNANNPATGRSLFQFYLNQLPQHIAIHSAKLTLYGNPTPTNNSNHGNNESYIRRVTSPWEENHVTWSTHPDYTYHNQVFINRSSFPVQDYLNIDVTNLVQDMINNPATSYGFIIMSYLEYPYCSLNFASSDCADVSKHPVLQIIYTTTGIQNTSAEVPASYKIYQNFPNPFNPVTNIKFDIPKSSNTKVIIYDVLGKEAAVLVNEFLNPGSYNVTWNGSNFSSGQYFYRIESGDFSETKKLMLIK